jgi:uncharacterized phiE125 gp8 family phage protein
MSALKLVTESTEEPVTLPEAKLWLRIDEHEVSEDALISSLVTRARQRWEEVTQRSAMVNTFDYYLDEEPDSACAISLPKAPLVGVTSIKGFSNTEATDSGGTAMATSGFYVDTAHEFGRVMALSGFTYPTATRDINPFVIRFTAGYSSGSSGVPDSVKTEIKNILAKLYEHRGDDAEQEKALAELAVLPSELDLPTWG